MATTLFDTATLIAVVQDLIGRKPSQFLLDMFFRQKANSETEHVVVDVIKGRRVIAPLVSPLVKAKVMEKKQRKSVAIAPAYVKPLFRVTPNDTIKRLAGEAMMGSLSREQRLNVLTQDAILDGISYIDRRMEVMAGDALVNGTITLEGEDYPTTTVDFQRDAALTGVTPDVDWDDTGNVPLDDLDAWNSLLIAKSGVGITDVVMEPTAWTNFRKNSDVKDLLKNFSDRQPGVSLPVNQLQEQGGIFMGTTGRWNYWQYQSSYIDPLDDTEKNVLPTGTVLALNTPNLMGIRHFGAIEDINAGLQALEYFASVHEEWNPSAREVMVQSAPLVSLQRPDASLAATVVGN